MEHACHATLAIRLSKFISLRRESVFTRKKDIILNKFNSILVKANLLDSEKDSYERYPNGWMHYNATRTAIGKELYDTCKNSIEEFKDELTPKEKGEIILNYISIWRATKSCLSIEDIGLDKEQFLKLAKQFNSEHAAEWLYTHKLNQVMFAGLNIANTKIKHLVMTDAIFYLTNFEKSDIGFDAREIHFLTCNFSGACPKDAGLLKSHFLNCNLQDADFTNVDFSHAEFKSCNVSNLTYEEGSLRHFRDCSNEGSTTGIYMSL